MSYLLLAFPLLLAILVVAAKVIAYWLWMDPSVVSQFEICPA